MDYYLLADMTVQIGYELAVAGAETYRVEETMRRVIEAYGTEGQAFAIPNCVAVSFVTPNTKPLTIMKRVGYHGNDLERIEKLNALSRRICAEVPDPETAQHWLKETTAAVRSYAVWIYYLGNFMAAAGFCCVFGGTVRDWLWAGLSGLTIGFVTRCMDRLEVNPFFSTIAASFLMALPAYVAAGLGWLDCVAVVIIGALIHKPKLLVMDEPFVGLDPKATYSMKEIMREICASGGAIFFSTHVLEVAEKLCNKIAIIKGGKLVANGVTQEVIGNESLEETFLELYNEK